MTMNPLPSSENFVEMMEEDEDTALFTRAVEQIKFAMEFEDIDFATALIVAARDYISDHYEDESMGYKICKIISEGKE